MTQQELLPNFSAALEAGLPEITESDSLLEDNNETDSDLYVNAGGKPFFQQKGVIAGLGALGGIATTLLVSDLVNKDKMRKQQQKSTAEQNRLQAEIASAQQAAQMAASEKEQLQAQMAALSANQGGGFGGGGKNNTMLYVGLGVGALVLLIGVASLAKR